MKKLMILIFVCFYILTGCAITATSGQEFDSSKVTLIKPGQTTKSEVLSYLGNPRSKTSMPGGMDTWSYSFGTSSTTDAAKSLIPVYGYFADKRITYNIEGVTIEFRGDVVADCTYTKAIEEGNIKYGMDVNSGGNKTTETTKCGATSGAAPAASTVSKEQIYETQLLLNKHGFNTGTPDGIMGGKTRNAIMKFQQGNGMPVDGKVSDVLLSRLRENAY